MDMAAWKNMVATAQAETGQIEFKSKFDPEVPRDWVETIKDVIAMHNSCGGVIVFGVDDDGFDAGPEGGVLAPVDPSHIVDKVRKYTGHVLRDVVLDRFSRGEKLYEVWVIPPAIVPVPFKEPGTWEKPDRTQGTVFSRGQIYFRHGAKSEFVCIDDMTAWAQRIADAARCQMIADMGKLVSIPLGATLQIVPPGARVVSDSEAPSVKITEDPFAESVRLLDPDAVFVHKQCEVVAALNKRLDRLVANRANIQDVRRAFEVDAKRKDFVRKYRSGAIQYSEQFVDWLEREYRSDPEFFAKARRKAREAVAA